MPSLTEAVALTAPGMLVGATDYCVHPAGLEVARVGGSKYPDLDAVLALRPDLVLMNVEENRLSRRRRAARRRACAMHVTYPRTVDQALRRAGRAVRGAGRAAARLARSRPWRRGSFPPVTPVRQAVIPVWRKPWVVLGSDTFAGDVLRRLGIGNVFGSDPSGTRGRRYRRFLPASPNWPYCLMSPISSPLPTARSRLCPTLWSPGGT